MSFFTRTMFPDPESKPVQARALYVLSVERFG